MNSLFQEKRYWPALIPFLFIYSTSIRASVFTDEFTRLYQEEKYQEGEQYIKNRAIETQNIKELYNLGATFYKQEKYTEAKDIFKQVKKGKNKERRLKEPLV